MVIFAEINFISILQRVYEWTGNINKMVLQCGMVKTQDMNEYIRYHFTKR